MTLNFRNRLSKQIVSEYNLQRFVQPLRILSMVISAGDVIPLSQARANLSELADQVRTGAEKIIAKNGESYVAIINAQRQDDDHQLERERIHLRLIGDASHGLADVAAGNVKEARSTLNAIKRRRAAKAAE